MNETELREWRRKDLVQVQKKIQEHRQENPTMALMAIEAKATELLGRLSGLVSSLELWPEGTVERRFLEKRIEILEDEIEREKAKLRPRKEGGITNEMIQRAKDYPISNLIEIKRGFALCLFHDERTPSMNIKGNRAYCFSCNHGWDSIDIYQKLNGCTFNEAVKALQ